MRWQRWYSLSTGRKGRLLLRMSFLLRGIFKFHEIIILLPNTLIWFLWSWLIAPTWRIDWLNIWLWCKTFQLLKRLINDKIILSGSAKFATAHYIKALSDKSIENLTWAWNAPNWVPRKYQILHWYTNKSWFSGSLCSDTIGLILLDYGFCVKIFLEMAPLSQKITQITFYLVLKR